jgi:hypothetical protein
MARVVLKEILIFIGALAIFPLVVLVMLFYSDSWSLGRAFLSRELMSGGSGPGGTSLTLWVRLVSPYIVIQSVRMYLWSHRSVQGRKWGNLYFAAVMTGVGIWSFAQAWDLFYFMYALGDIPGELVQFVHLEANNLLVGVGCFVLAGYCLKIFFYPATKKRDTPNDPKPQE